MSQETETTPATNDGPSKETVPEQEKQENSSEDVIVATEAENVGAKFKMPGPLSMEVLKEVEAERQAEMAAHGQTDQDTDQEEIVEEDAPDLAEHNISKRSILNPRLLKVFAYSGRAWKMEVASGTVVATAGLVLIIIGVIRYYGFGHVNSFIIAGVVVFCLGFVFMIRAIFWFINHKEAKKETRNVEHHLLPNLENGAAITTSQQASPAPTPV